MKHPEPSPLAPAAKRARRKDARPGELLDAALTLFVEKGFAATRVDEVAQKAGVSKGTLFLYFPTKEELFKAVVRQNISGHFPQWTAEMDAYEGHSASLLRRAIDSWWMQIMATKASGIPKLMMSEARNFPELATFYRQEVVEPGHQMIRRVLQRGIDRGEFRPMDTNLGLYAVLAPLWFLMTWEHSLGSCSGIAAPNATEFIGVQIEVLLHGLCTEKAPSQPFPESDSPA